MPISPTYPGLYIEELPSSARTITAAPTSVTVFVGYTNPFAGECAERNLWNTAVQIFSFTEYERIFGGLYSNPIVRNDVAQAVYQFFLNGGSNAYVVALKPGFVDPPNNSPIVPAEVAGAFGGFTFTARQLTDAKHPVRVTIRNVRLDTAGLPTIADFSITYGQRSETYTDVITVAGVPSTITDPRYIANRFKRSSLVKVNELDQPTPAQYAAAVGTSAFVDLGVMTTPATTTWTTFDAVQFTSVFNVNSSLDKVDIFNLLVIPGVHNSAIASAALSFCERKYAFYIIDPPAGTSADGLGGLPEIDTATAAFPKSSPNGALYFPYLKRFDPMENKEVATAPSGYVAGIFARTDVSRGVWKAPAGLETSILNTTGVVEEGVMTDMRQGVLNPLGINVLRGFAGAGTVVWGARTIVTNNTALQQWRYVPVRRMALFLEQTLLRNLGWVVFEPNDRPLWTAIRLSIENFMLTLFRQGAFQGSTPSQAFLVQCDDKTTTQTDIDNGIVNILVGFRPLKPAEFVIIKIAQLAGQVQS